MIGGHSKFEQPACRAVYLSKRLAALQRIFRASLYAVRLMPRRKRLLTALFALRNIDGDVRHKIMQMAGLANFRTSFPPYTLWEYKNRISQIAPLGVLIVEGYHAGDNIDPIVNHVFELITQARASAA